MLTPRQMVGSHDVLFITLDTLRYDVAAEELRANRTPNLARRIGQWELRHTPASFTYAAHQAFFAGFLPTPVAPGPHPRLFAVGFGGSESIAESTAVFDTPDIVRGFAAAGYHTVCIGGVGFFNPASPLGRVLPGLFAESHWSPALGVTDPHSTENQVALALGVLGRVGPERRLFLFVNVSALHQPNRFYLPGAHGDTKQSHAAALRYVDRELEPLLCAFERRGPTLCIITSDHGTAYGDGGYVGHRCAHPVVWEVPYAELVLSRGAA